MAGVLYEWQLVVSGRQPVSHLVADVVAMALCIERVPGMCKRRGYLLQGRLVFTEGVNKRERCVIVCD